MNRRRRRKKKKEDPDLQVLRRWMLATRDAHGLYAKYGFVPIVHPERLMENHQPDVFIDA